MSFSIRQFDNSKFDNMLARVIIFLILNFVALGIGGFFTGPGTSSEWYNNLNQAPWTPPGWVFGAAWTTIMIC
ncbi:MAG: TspO/MBR family protein, partial [Bacteroidota bacterium]